MFVRSIIILLLLISSSVYAQEEGVIGDSYMQSIMGAMDSKYEFKATTKPLHVSFNLYDLKKTNLFATVDSVLFQTVISERGKLLAGFGMFKFLPGVSQKMKKRSPLKDNDALCVFVSYGSYIAFRSVNYGANNGVNIFRFNTATMVLGDEIPIALIVSGDVNVDSSILDSLLNKQNLSSISLDDISPLSSKYSIIRLITYKIEE